MRFSKLNQASLFICVHLLLSLDKIGCTSELKVENYVFTCPPLGLHYLCGLFFRRVPTGARLKGGTLKLEAYYKSTNLNNIPITIEDARIANGGFSHQLKSIDNNFWNKYRINNELQKDFRLIFS